ncbi:MAG: OmpH family outer membrane protein [Desulfatiglandaceae bacterium]
MKRMLFLFFWVFLLFGFQSETALGAENAKFGIVDIEKFQDESKAFQKIREELKAKFDLLQKGLDKKKDELLEIEAELKKQSMMLSLDAKEDKRRELERKRRHYKYLAEDSTEEMKQAQLDARKELAQELEKVVNMIGKQEGFTMIIEKRTVGLVYFDKAIDITDRVIKAYDKLAK